MKTYYIKPVFFLLIISIDLLGSFINYIPCAIDSATIAGNAHYNSGGRRIVRINNLTLALCSVGSADWTYRSKDNGKTWECIDKDGTFSGCLISSSDSLVYHFYRSADNIYMVKFLYNQTPPAPRSIYSEKSLTGKHGAYDMITATVDSKRRLYVSAHWNPATDERQESLYLIRSDDNGQSWNPSGKAYLIRQGDSLHSWGYIHMDVTIKDELVCSYSEWGSYSLQFAKSSNYGETWTTVQLEKTEKVGQEIYNPAILPVGAEELFVFAQSARSSPHGLVFKKSVDAGKTWSSWQVIDSAGSAGYADPSPALASNGDIFVAFRSGALPALSGKSGGDAYRERLAQSSNGGKTWTFPDNYFFTSAGTSTERVGTRSQLRYQTWWNYGGPLEWIWLQSDDSALTTYYDMNSDVSIFTLGKVSFLDNETSQKKMILNNAMHSTGNRYYDLCGRSDICPSFLKESRHADGIYIVNKNITRIQLKR